MRSPKDLFEYQNNSIQQIIENKNIGLFIQMGLGKTIVTLTAIEYLLNQDLDIDKVLIIAPPPVVDQVWIQEASQWEHVRELKIAKVRGNKKERLAILSSSDAQVFLFSNNHHIVKDMYEYLLQLTKLKLRCMLVVDESSLFKNPSSVRFKTLRKTLTLFHRKVILTGTPSSNSYVDLWSQMYILDQGERLSKSYGRYLLSYFTQSVDGRSFYIIKSRKKELFNKVGEISISIKADKHIQLPPIKYVDHVIELPLSIKKGYDEFRRNRMLSLFDTTITTAHMADLLNKLFQYSNGAIYDKDGDTHYIHEEKLKGLKNLIDQLGDQACLIAYTYRSDKDRILKYLESYKPVVLKGAEQSTAWNNREIKVMLMNPASGGHGLNLQHGGNIIIWFGQTYSLQLYEQFNARLFRKGQTNTVFIYRIMIKDTEDKRAFISLANKSENQNSLLNSLKEEIKNIKKI